jgi:hypothetical protein
VDAVLYDYVVSAKTYNFADQLVVRGDAWLACHVVVTSPP